VRKFPLFREEKVRAIKFPLSRGERVRVRGNKRGVSGWQ